MVKVSNNAYFKIKLKGDDKKYQLRIKTNRSDYQSYVASFQTSSEWETIIIALKDMYPSFRGRKIKYEKFQ